MSEFKGTSGPWELRVEALDQTVALDVIGCGVMVSSATPWSSDTECDTDKALANANLIAAAPELLEALQDMFSGWKYIRQTHGDLYGVGWDRAEQKAADAIAKALGQ